MSISFYPNCKKSPSVLRKLRYLAETSLDLFLIGKRSNTHITFINFFVLITLYFTQYLSLTAIILCKTQSKCF